MAQFWNDSAFASFLEGVARWASFPNSLQLLLVQRRGEVQEKQEVPAVAGGVQPGYSKKNPGQIPLTASFLASHTGGN